MSQRENIENFLCLNLVYLGPVCCHGSRLWDMFLCCYRECITPCSAQLPDSLNQPLRCRGTLSVVSAALHHMFWLPAGFEHGDGKITSHFHADQYNGCANIITYWRKHPSSEAINMYPWVKTGDPEYVKRMY